MKSRRLLRKHLFHFVSFKFHMLFVVHRFLLYLPCLPIKSQARIDLKRCWNITTNTAISKRSTRSMFLLTLITSVLSFTLRSFSCQRKRLSSFPRVRYAVQWLLRSKSRQTVLRSISKKSSRNQMRQSSSLITRLFWSNCY